MPFLLKYICKESVKQTVLDLKSSPEWFLLWVIYSELPVDETSRLEMNEELVIWCLQ